MYIFVCVKFYFSSSPIPGENGSPHVPVEAATLDIPAVRQIGPLENDVEAAPPDISADSAVRQIGPLENDVEAAPPDILQEQAQIVEK